MRNTVKSLLFLSLLIFMDCNSGNTNKAIVGVWQNVEESNNQLEFCSGGVCRIMAGGIWVESDDSTAMEYDYTPKISGGYNFKLINSKPGSGVDTTHGMLTFLEEEKIEVFLQVTDSLSTKEVYAKL